MNIFKSFFFTLCILFLSTTAFAKDPPIRIGFNTWPGYDALSIAQQKGFFEKEGVSVELLVFESLTDIQASYERGEIDMMASTTLEVLSSQSRGYPVQTILMTDYSNGADAICVKNNIKSLSELKGKMVAVEIGSIGHYMLLRALQKAGLTLKDVSIENMVTTEAEKAFIDGVVQVMVSWDPFISRAAKNGEGYVIFSSSEIPGEIVDTLSARPSLIKSRPNAVEAVVRAWYRTMDWIKDNPEEAVSMLAKFEKLSIQEMKKTLEGIQPLHLKENQKAFGEKGKPGPLFANTEAFQKFLLEYRVLKKKNPISDILNPRFIWKLEVE